MTIRLLHSLRYATYPATALIRDVYHFQDTEEEHGIGRAFFIPVLVCSILTVLVGALSITMHLKNYQRVGLQR